MRSKEDAQDYRYFPEPDLQPLIVESAWVDAIRATLPELPEARKARYGREHGLSDYDADVIVRLEGGAAYFEAMIRAGTSPKIAANWIQGEVRRVLKEQGVESLAAFPVSAAALADLASLTERGVISSSASKVVLERMLAAPGRPAQAIVDAEGLVQVDDAEALGAMVRDVLAAHPAVVAQYQSGKTAVFGFLVGHVMKMSRGKANPQAVGDLLRAALTTNS
jgi:aspartyl-tRNA(Asn)/glutamyl-tRNA(Gln) amidotransferase subunit B